ncbi:MAG TPA: HAD-IA family hydrolase, partial [Tepidiformaceae bacterium]|nr:HAD-IA family hydrolase [Tepidiformaceae bacterium]
PPGEVRRDRGQRLPGTEALRAHEVEPDVVVAEPAPRGPAEPLDGATCLVLDLHRRQVPIALASSSRRPWVDACLARIGLDGVFDEVVTGSDVANGKPDPEIYLLAAKRLRLPASACLAIEDAPAGIASARAAGMRCWAVRTEYTRGLDLGEPDREFDSLSDIAIGDILEVAA